MPKLEGRPNLWRLRSSLPGITYVSLIIGELVPKQIALADPERVAVKVAPLMLIVAKLAFRIVVILDLSAARLILKADRGSAVRR